MRLGVIESNGVTLDAATINAVQALAREFRSETAELNRRVQVTATNSWRPTPTEEVGREDDYQVAAPTETRTPPCTERISLTKECGWKDGDRGGLAQWELVQGKKKMKVRLDINRPSHGRS
jgi:hypothetical protein